MILEKTVISSTGKVLETKIEKIVPWSYYWVELAFTPSNIPHKAVMATTGYFFNEKWILDKFAYFFNTGYEPESLKTDITRLAYLKVLMEIDIDKNIENKEIVLEKQEGVR